MYSNMASFKNVKTAMTEKFRGGWQVAQGQVSSRVCQICWEEEARDRKSIYLTAYTGQGDQRLTIRVIRANRQISARRTLPLAQTTMGMNPSMNNSS